MEPMELYSLWLNCFALGLLLGHAAADALPALPALPRPLALWRALGPVLHRRDPRLWRLYDRLDGWRIMLGWWPAYLLAWSALWGRLVLVPPGTVTRRTVLTLAAIARPSRRGSMDTTGTLI